MNKNKSNEIDTIYGKEKLKITCVERKYKVAKPAITFIITAKTELDEDTTGRLLQEDMELKTFLANYEITDIMLPAAKSSVVDHILEIDNVKLVQRSSSEKINRKNEKYKKIPTYSVTAARRALFDSLDLPQEFTTRNYTDAIEKNGMRITNSAMPYDDLKYFQKQGKVTKLKKTAHGLTTYKLVKVKNDNVDVKNDNIDIKNDNIDVKNDNVEIENKIFI